jgi:type IV pilus assembly protein PilM
MPIIGLNIGKNSFRAVELDRRKDNIYVNKFGIYDTVKLNLESDKPDDIQAASTALHAFFSEMSFSSPEVVVGLNETSVYMRIIKLPQMTDKELKGSIKYEVEQYIPVPINDVNISYQKLAPDYTDKDKIDVQIVAAKKTTLDRYVSFIRGAHLIPRAIEPETIALTRVLGDTHDAPLGTIILEMGMTSTLIIISYEGFVRFSRSIPIGGESLTRAVQQGLSLDIMQAEEYKKVYGMDQNQVEGKVYNLLKPLIDNIVVEVQRASLFFTNHNSSANIKRVILTGGTALMPGLLLYIARSLEYEVELANPIRNIAVSPKLEEQKNILMQLGPIYSTAIGLALREV